ncbi:hypothetical protein BV898_10970 [Hypsibius exemplaris]|uniref:Uncharacterized protein n=1 Tax=Hypsibius exemplaris TaxID=2072580 RepID=A0A1W0WI13_HYPEX|nr:hypothetical protein BV898_10970 [Hypsibius exemplaris]
MYPSGSSHRHRHPPPFTANMHGPIPRILEPSPEPVLAGGGLTSRGTTHSSAQQQLQQQQSTPTTQFFQPGDVYATFQTAYSSGPHHAPFALPSPYNTPWTTTGRGGPPKMRPRFPLHQQQRHKYPALTFTHHPQLPNGQPQRNFFRPPSTATATTVNGYLAPGRPMMNGGGGAYRSTNSTPPAVTAGVVPPSSSSSMVNNPFLFVSPDTSSQQQSQRRHSMPSTAGIAPYFVDLHVGSGSAVQVDNGPEKHIVTGE